MSSAKAALESDTRVLAFEAGRKFGVRVNTISAGPLGSRAAKVHTQKQQRTARAEIHVLHCGVWSPGCGRLTQLLAACYRRNSRT